jgi:hypothetical protein
MTETLTPKKEDDGMSIYDECVLQIAIARWEFGGCVGPLILRMLL